MHSGLPKGEAVGISMRFTCVNYELKNATTIDVDNDNVLAHKCTCKSVEVTWFNRFAPFTKWTSPMAGSRGRALMRGHGTSKWKIKRFGFSLSRTSEV